MKKNEWTPKVIQDYDQICRARDNRKLFSVAQAAQACGISAQMGYMILNCKRVDHVGFIEYANKLIDETIKKINP